MKRGIGKLLKTVKTTEITVLIDNGSINESEVMIFGTY